MERLLALPVAQAGDDPLLSDERGAPVWPYAGPDERALLAQVATLFGREIVDVQPASRGPRDGGERLVAGYDEGAERAGRLYAHLTGRRYVHVGSPREATAMDAVDVVVCVAPSAPHDLLDEITRARRNARLGILWAADAGSLSRQARIRAAAARLDPAPLDRATVLSPMTGHIEPVRVGAVELRGALKTPGDLETGPHAVMALTTHSDGIDALLGERATLCALVDLDPSSVPGGPSPKCVITGQCHRQKMRVAEALASGRLVPARALSSRVLMWNSCFGIMGRHWSVVDAWGLMPQLLASAEVGCLVALRAIVNTGPVQVIPLVATLHEGVSVGDALAAWRETLGRQSHAMIRDRLFLFGDPAVVANPAREAALDEAALDEAALDEAAFDEAALDEAALDMTAPSPSAPVEATEAPLILRFLENVRAWQPDLSPAVDACRAAVEASELARSSTTPGPRAELEAALRRTLLGVLTRTMWSSWLDSWLPTATLREELAGRTCGDCGADLWAGVYDVSAPGGAPRYFASCASCGAVDDRPASCDAVIERADHGLGLSRGGPQRDWSGALVSAPIGPDLVSTEWPRGEDDLPLPECRLTGTSQVGPIFRLAMFIEASRVSIHMRRAFLATSDTP
ncbi:hypothetical protein [Sorangium sp. So ce363]|uniref:hypothetical protein n=1 Tax=Sorangium sp. So ce363 TaxID=3133304 RepID=UPI003F5D7A03